MPALHHHLAPALPGDAGKATLAGRVWLPAAGGSAIAAIRPAGVFDVSRDFPTMRDLCETPDPARALASAPGSRIGDFATILANTPADRRDRDQPWLLAPVDLQALKAAGVTFAISLLERVIEERARGDLAAAARIRDEVTGKGFTHRSGDIVSIATPKLGRLVNRVRPTDQCEPWAMGAGALMRNLANRGLLNG